MTRWTLIGCLVGAALSLSACAIAPAAPLPSSKEPAAALSAPRAAPKWLGSQFDDIPLPAELALDYDVSYMNVSAHAPRVADLRYTGKTSPIEVLTYMQRSMSGSGWEATSVTGVGVKTLRFVKDQEECVLVIHTGKGNQTVLMVRLHPRL